MKKHVDQESRKPTDAEMNLMVDEIRMAYKKTFGKAAYERAVSASERNLTDERMKNNKKEDFISR